MQICFRLYLFFRILAVIRRLMYQIAHNRATMLLLGKIGVCRTRRAVSSRHLLLISKYCILFFFQAEDGIRCYKVTGVQTCALPILNSDGADNPSSAAADAN